MNNMPRIQQVSRKFRLLFTGLIFLIPLLQFLYWLFFNDLPEGMSRLFPAANDQALSLQTRAMAFSVSLIPMGVAMFGMYTLAKLFKLYEKAIIFAAENVKHFRTLGYVCFFWVIAGMISVPLINLIIAFNSPPEQRTVVALFELPDMAALIIGAIILLISWVMDEGRKLEDEQAHTV